MKALFLDCNDQLAPVWLRVWRGGDPAIDVNRAPFASADLPRLLEGYDICIDDHSYMPTEFVDRCSALLPAAARDVARMDREVRAGIWTPHEGVQLLGKTLGVIGLGGIGAEVLRLGRGLGMEVIAWNRSPRPGAPLVQLDELLERSDAISMNLTLNDETRGFLGPAQFARMKPGVLFVNTARAALVDEAAFIAALC